MRDDLRYLIESLCWLAVVLWLALTGDAADPWDCVRHNPWACVRTVEDQHASPRSPKWPSLERRLINEHPWCAACGKTLDQLQAIGARLTGHHIVPFHLNEARELDPANVICLCDAAGPGADRRDRCHWLIGHNGKSWGDSNPQVVADAAALFAKRHPAQPAAAPVQSCPNGQCGPGVVRWGWRWR